jgi:lysophospholipase L1-like esterase
MTTLSLVMTSVFFCLLIGLPMGEGIEVTLRRGTNSEIEAFVPALAEVVINTDDSTVHVGNGSTPGGVKQAKASDLNPINETLEELGLEVNNLDSIHRSRSLSGINVKRPVNTWGMRAPINNLGDSISHGAFAGELYYNGWTRILARMLSGDFGGLSYQGFVPMLTLGSGPSASRDIHSITLSGTWDAQDSASTVNGAMAYNGISFQSIASGDYVQTTIPSFQNKANVWYLQQPGGGEITVSDNTGNLSVINTDGVLSVQSLLVATVDDGQGSCFIRCTKTDTNANPVDICGFGYLEGVDTPTLHNFSQSGRRLHYVADQTISDLSANAAIFMLSLGHNDQGDVDADPQGAYATQFTSKIDKIIEQCNLNNTLLVVNDFCWTAADTSFTRHELQRAAKETKGVYIPLPNLIKPDGSVPDSSYIVSTINMWEDGSYPNADGNKWIAETIAKYLGLSCSNKKMAIATNDYWMPFAIPAGTENSFTNPANVSAYRINGEELNYRYAVQKGAGGSFPVGTHSLQTVWRVDPPFVAIGTSLTLAGMPRSDTSVLTSTVGLGGAGAVGLTVGDGSWINDQSGIAKLPIVLN